MRDIARDLSFWIEADQRFAVPGWWPATQCNVAHLAAAHNNGRLSQRGVDNRGDFTETYRRTPTPAMEQWCGRADPGPYSGRQPATLPNRWLAGASGSSP